MPSQKPPSTRSNEHERNSLHDESLRFAASPASWARRCMAVAMSCSGDCRRWPRPCAVASCSNDGGLKFKHRRHRPCRCSADSGRQPRHGENRVLSRPEGWRRQPRRSRPSRVPPVAYLVNRMSWISKLLQYPMVLTKEISSAPATGSRHAWGPQKPAASATRRAKRMAQRLHHLHEVVAGNDGARLL